MNERIQELAKQVYGSSATAQEIKFGELIVRECAMIYEKIDNGNLHEGTDDYIEALSRTFRG